MSVWFKSRLNPWYIWIPSNPYLYSTKIIMKMRWQTIASNVSIRTISPTATPLPKAYDCVAVYIAGRRTSLVVYGWWPQPPTKNQGLIIIYVNAPGLYSRISQMDRRLKFVPRIFVPDCYMNKYNLSCIWMLSSFRTCHTWTLNITGIIHCRQLGGENAVCVITKSGAFQIKDFSPDGCRWSPTCSNPCIRH